MSGLHAACSSIQENTRSPMRSRELQHCRPWRTHLPATLFQRSCTLIAAPSTPQRVSEELPHIRHKAFKLHQHAPQPPHPHPHPLP